MASFNRVILVGNLTRDVELKYLQSGMAVGEFGLAINDRRKAANGEWVEDTVFVDITLWGRTAEIAGEYLQKGAPVLIEGRLKYDTWEKDGKKQSKLRVVGDKMQMLGTRTPGSSGPGGSAGPNGSSSASNRPAQRPASRPADNSQFAGASNEYSGHAEVGGDVGGDSGEGDIPF